jgi:hypothetical protein
MGTIELFLILILALIYLAIPIITLSIVVQINREIKQIEQGLNSALKPD